MGLLPHVFLQDIPGLERLLAEDADVLVQMIFQQVDQFMDKDQVVRLTHAEIVVEGHVVQQDGAVPFEHVSEKKI